MLGPPTVSVASVRIENADGAWEGTGLGITPESNQRLIEVWNLTGKRLYQVADVPLAENIPIGGVRTGRRNVEWRSGQHGHDL